jgi:hypothetical protein
MRKVIVAVVITTALFSSSFTPLASAATNPKAGATCTKVGKTAIYKGKKFTCVKSGKKLIWNKGVVVLVVKPSPTPTPIKTPITTPSPTPSIPPLATPTPSPSASSTPLIAPSPSATSSPSASATPKPEPVKPTHAGTAEDPQLFNSILVKNGVKIKVIKVTDNVSELVCKTELIRAGCDFGGAVDIESESRFVEIVITVINDGTEIWDPVIFGLKKDDDYYGGDFILNGDIPIEFELEVGKTITLNTYVALSNDIEISDCLFFISETTAEEAFFIEVK